MRYTLGFIGCGNMGGALIRALSKKTNDIMIADFYLEKAQALAEELNLKWGTNDEIALTCDRIFLAVKPQIIKKYALGQYNEMSSLILSGIRFNLLFILIITIPLIFCTDFILGLWLKEVPEGCALFCRILMWATVVSSIAQLLLAGIQATGELKLTSIVRNVLYIITPLMLYVIFLCWDTIPAVAYIVVFASQVLTALADIFILKLLVPTFKLDEIFSVIIKALAIILILCFLNKHIISLDFGNFTDLLLVSVNTAIILSASFYFFIFSDTERKAVKKFMITFLRKIKQSC